MNLLQKITALTVLTFSVVVMSWCTGSSSDDAKNVALAQCLTAKWVTMYGTNRCSHCQAQKELFGYEAFTKINFVDCDKNKNACGLAWVKWYPTWAFADGTKLEGTQNFDALAAKAWCSIDGSAIVTDQVEDVAPATITTGAEDVVQSGAQETITGVVSTGN